MDRISRLYLVRHGQVRGYEECPIVGSTDVELTEVGIHQMEHLAQRLQLTEIKAIYSSDLQRSLTGARIIARHHNVPLYALPELREMHFGAWEGLSLKVLRERFPAELDRREEDMVNYRPPGDGESAAMLSERVLAALRSMIEKQAGGDLLLVGHGGVNRVILCDALGLPLSRFIRIHQDYGCLNIIDYLPGATLVRLVNG